MVLIPRRCLLNARDRTYPVRTLDSRGVGEEKYLWSIRAGFLEEAPKSASEEGVGPPPQRGLFGLRMSWRGLER